MAADTLITRGSGDGRGVIRKITPIRIEGRRYVLGMAGNAMVLNAFARWVENGAETDECPHDLLQDDGEALLMNAQGEVQILTRGRGLVFDAPFFATGSGEEYALGAMALGATALEAVMTAARFDYATAGPFDVYDIRHDVMTRVRL